MYYRFKSDQKHRMFRVDWDNQKVTQVVIWGKKKKGRPNMRGVYEISWSTWVGYCHICYRDYLTTTTERLYNFWAGVILCKLLDLDK